MHNEQENVTTIYSELETIASSSDFDIEIVMVNDGSTDDTAAALYELQQQHPELKVIDFSRNFGKEIALAAGLHNCSGDAAIMIDADMQHPPRMIPEFVKRWRAGAEVVIGVRQGSAKNTALINGMSVMYYKLMNTISDTFITPNATDFRLIDRQVIDAYNSFSEKGRITRGLIDWLGFNRDFVEFEPDNRTNGEARYSFKARVRLAVDSFVSMSIFPLKLSMYIGGLITLISGPLALYIAVDKLVLSNPFGFSFSGTSALAVVVLFLSGITLMNVGLMGYYVASIHRESLDRPLYVTRQLKPSGND